ncbi:putative transposase, Ptta/En/Spm, plant [Helianthus anomalus]
MLLVVHFFSFCRFNDHDKVSRTIGSNLKSMWSGPWKGWKDVPSHHRERLFERFQQYYRWEDNSKSSIHSCGEKCIKGKFPDLLKRARDKAKALAIQEGAEVENDLTPILPFKPLWMSQESWETLVHAWNTISWKNKASQNSDNRGKATGGRHTLGSKSFLTVRKNMEKTLKRHVKFGEFWLQTHAKKGSRPLDGLLGSSSSIEHGSGEGGDMEGNIHEHNVTWVDTRASEAYVSSVIF